MIELSECQECGAEVPDKMAFLVIHAERNHPEMYAEMVRDYYRDLREHDLLEQERSPLNESEATEIEIE